ncbi:MAG: rhomboid family intramembrane serine protease, partial [Rhodothermaceae bacterium]
ITIGGEPGKWFINKYFALNGFDSRMNFQLWQLISYQFMHANFSHIFWNMFILWMFGVEIANMFGNKKFWMFYLLSGIGAGLFQAFLGDATSVTVGASGAVYGVMIAFAMFFPDRSIYLYFLIPVKAKYLIGFMFVLDFLMIGDGGITAHLAHVGGAISGAIFILADKQSNFSQKVINWMNSYKRPSSGGSSGNSGFNFRKPFQSSNDNVKEAQFYDINDSKSSEDISQEEIDKILDKISRSGYQNLTEKEKRILFEASKKN